MKQTTMSKQTRDTQSTCNELIMDDIVGIIVEFTKEEVLSCNPAYFLERYGPEVLPEGSELAAMMGRVHFGVQGWDDDPREVYSIPEVRTFYQQFYRVWPDWFFFCSLESPCLTMMTLCLMPELHDSKRLDQTYSGVIYDPLDLMNFISANWVIFNTMMERAGMSEMDIYNRTRDIMLYYKFPFNVNPPEE